MQESNVIETKKRHGRTIVLIIIGILIILVTGLLIFINCYKKSDNKLTENKNNINEKSKKTNKKENKESKEEDETKQDETKEEQDITIVEESKGSIKDIIYIDENKIVENNGIKLEVKKSGEDDDVSITVLVNNKKIDTGDIDTNVLFYKDIVIFSIYNGTSESDGRIIYFVDKSGNIIKKITGVEDKHLDDVYVDENYKPFSYDDEKIYFKASAIEDGEIPDSYKNNCDSIIKGLYSVTYSNGKVSDILTESTYQTRNYVNEGC